MFSALLLVLVSALAVLLAISWHRTARKHRAKTSTLNRGLAKTRRDNKKLLRDLQD